MLLSDINSIMITGGTGSFGKAFCRNLINNYPNINRIVIFSRDELKQYEMSLEYGSDERLRFFLGDIRDADRLKAALSDIDVVVHAAALKQVPAAEYNPFEFIKTNVIGAQNVIQSSIDTGVKRVVALSTDKAAAPINLYGATKLCSDKLFTAANNYIGKNEIRFSVVRYGNVFGSRGSVVPLFLKQKRSGQFTITDTKMTRFNISLSEGVKMVMDAISTMKGGEIFVPTLKSYRVSDLANAIDPLLPVKLIGLRQGEKIHEEMITSADSFLTRKFDEYFIIFPNSEFMLNYENDVLGKGQQLPEGFSYNSGENEDFLSIEELKGLVEEYDSQH